MSLARTCLVLCLLLVSTGSYAQLSLEVVGDELSASEQAASQALLQDALQVLPPQFRQRLDRKVNFSWQQLPEQVYGRTVKVDQIRLNQRLLPALVDGSAQTQQTNRPHGTVRKELLATVIHELTHLYDRAQLWPTAEKIRLQRCQNRASSSGLVGLPDNCRGETARRFTLSDDPRLLDIAGWPQYVGRRGEREQENHQVARSPDLYELENAREFVAVNMEYFLLDPDFACRRPTLAAYYREQFAWTPPNQAKCDTSLAYLNAGNDFAKEPLGKIDPERVYAVDYLLAEANDQLASRWGHSMIRLIICAPGRPRGPACRLDLDQSLVLSYRAFIGDVQLSSWGAMIGAYPSRLFVLPLAQVVDEYTKTELRSLISVPMNLDRQQINDFVTRSVEQHWSYDGNYYFLSNNCAVENLKLLRTGTNNPKLQTLDSIMPNGLLEVLEARGLADSTVLKDRKEAMRLGYLFDSYRDRYQAMFDVLRTHLPIKQESVDDWLELPAKQRSQWFAQADIRTTAAMMLLEKAAQRKQILVAQQELKERYLSGRKVPDKGLDKAGNALEQILANSGFLSRPAEMLEGGYGLPQPAEWQRLETESSNRQKYLLKLRDSLDNEVRSLLEPERLAELETIEDNLKLLGKHLREMHKASGGLMLP
ncbi:DUF7844 domain-containing protein [Pseudomonas sp. S9]|uniref:DUF7844 domain-containing protein n=1 Tax=Pseudomonas sp. S9 TaxID=686578 RepID=UPI000255735D|nr:DUF4105 domain-containing protein [Pseudomonas sp. S9]